MAEPSFYSNPELFAELDAQLDYYCGLELRVRTSGGDSHPDGSRFSNELESLEEDLTRSISDRLEIEGGSQLFHRLVNDDRDAVRFLALMSLDSAARVPPTERLQLIVNNWDAVLRINWNSEDDRRRTAASLDMLRETLRTLAAG